MVADQGEIWWAELGEPVGSAPGYRRPVLVIQGDSFNRSRIDTVVCVALTGNARLARMPGNVLLRAGDTGLDCDSVALGSAIVTIDRGQLTERVGKVTRRKLELVFAGIDVVLGR